MPFVWALISCLCALGFMLSLFASSHVFGLVGTHLWFVRARLHALYVCMSFV